MSIKYIPYSPRPVSGQAILSSESLLRFQGVEKLRHLQGMPLYDVAKTEQVGTNPSGQIFQGDCLNVCSHLKVTNQKIDLVYIDPPFDSGAQYAKKIYLRQNPDLVKKLEAKSQELKDLNKDKQAFEEDMYGDIWRKEDYLSWMYERLLAIRQVMSETASIYVHLDWHIGHYVKVMMDEIFGEENFRNEIVWKYESGGRPEKFFARKHDVIFWYSKTEEYTFNPDKVGELRGTKKRNNMKKETDKDGRTFYSIKSNGKIYKYYDDEKITPDDVWTISHLQQQDPERTDYATQKPEALLERIIKASSNPEDTVADFFGGSGVTAAVAHRLGRKFIHSDVGINSIQTTRDRLKNNKAEFAIYRIKDGLDLFRNPTQTMQKLKENMPKNWETDIFGDYWFGAEPDENGKMCPVWMPNLVDSRTKLFTEANMLKTLHEVALSEVNVSKVIIYYVQLEDETDKPFHKMIADYDLRDEDGKKVEFEFRDLKDILDYVFVDDKVEFEMTQKDEGYLIQIKNFISTNLEKKIDEYNQKKFTSYAKKKNIDVSDDLIDKSEYDYGKIQISKNGLELIEAVHLDCQGKDIWHTDTEIKIDPKTSYVIKDGVKTKDFWDSTIYSKNKPKRIKIRNIAGDEVVVDVEG